MPSLAPWERRLARLVHGAFYALTLALPLTGWLMVSASRLAVPTRLFGIVAWPHLPGVANLAPAQKAMVLGLAERGHGALAWIAVALLIVHVAGALKHQVLRPGEPVLTRMAPGARPGRWLEPRLGAVLAGAAAVAAAAGLVSPPFPARAPQDPPVALPVLGTAAGPDPDPATFGDEPQTPVDREQPRSPEPTAWTLSNGARLSFTTAWSGKPIEGRFSRWRARIRFGPAALDRSRVVVTVDLGSIDTRDPQRDEALRGPDWFDTAAARNATFSATRFEFLGDRRYIAHGVLALRGVERPLSVPFRLKIQGREAVASGEAVVDRTTFGVGQGEFGATDQVPGAVRVAFDLKARTPQAAPREP
jgi:polyisoprenoid-binding protein YceI